VRDHEVGIRDGEVQRRSREDDPGQAAEQVATRKTGLEITVKLDSGALVAVVQEADEAFKPGERVRILSGSGVSRVTH